ncbi:MAG TPA: efflux transporter outer membrane subunit [Polyangia bacterium]|jgi:multidrug efflux system outer membrane protein|nr:efflux transporter outer membrane subunit [Polyangia bacterium]
MSARHRVVLSLVLGIALGGCLVGPDYRRPKTPEPDTFRGQAPGGPDSFADLPWWEVFQDEHLLALLREALDHSYSLQNAAARVEQAREAAGVAADTLLPTISVHASPSYQQVFTPPRLAPRNQRYPLYTLGGGLSWEVDVWGRLRRLREAALAEYLGTEEARRGVIVSLVGEVAQNYFQLLTLDEQLAIAQRTVAARRDTLRLFQEREQGGVGDRLQTASEEANLAGAAATIPNLEQQIAARENLISILLGRPPGPILRSRDIFHRPSPPELPAGLPGSLVERRPDLRQAEAGLIAANAQVGAAFAQFFPQFVFNASGGVESASLSTTFTTAAATFGVSLVVNWLIPLLNGYQIKHRYRAQQANWRALVAAYRQTVLNALAEVSNALIAVQKLREQRTQLEAEVRARNESVELAKVRFRNGVASYLEVVQAEQNLFPAELQLAQTIGAQFVAMTQLYRALGGGWQLPPPPPGEAKAARK